MKKTLIWIIVFLVSVISSFAWLNPSQLITYYTFDNSSGNAGTNITDVASGKHNASVIAGNIGYSSTGGINNSGFIAGCTSGRIIINQTTNNFLSSVFNGVKNWTVMFYYKRNVTGGVGNIFSFDAYTTIYSRLIYIVPNQNIYWYASTDGSSWNYLNGFGTSVQPVDNVWNLYALTSDGVNIKAYKNSTLNQTQAIGTGLAIIDNVIATICAGQNQGLNDFIDDFMIWNRTISQTEIADWMQNHTLVAPLLSISIQSPTNNSFYPSTNVSLNYTILYNIANQCWYENITGSTIQLPNCQNTTFIGIEGINNITVYANDSINTTNSTQAFFIIDTITPSLSIQSPTNNSIYNTTSIDINFTFSDANPDKCRITNATGGTINGCNNLTQTLSDGNYNITVYVNDTVNHINSSQIFFEVSARRANVSFVNSSISWSESFNMDTTPSVYSNESNGNWTAKWYLNNTGDYNATNFTAYISGIPALTSMLTVYQNFTSLENGTGNLISVKFTPTGTGSFNDQICFNFVASKYNITKSTNCVPFIMAVSGSGTPIILMSMGGGGGAAPQCAIDEDCILSLGGEYYCMNQTCLANTSLILSADQCGNNLCQAGFGESFFSCYKDCAPTFEALFCQDANQACYFSRQFLIIIIIIISGIGVLYLIVESGNRRR